MSQILLVEDDPLAQDIAASILREQGFDVDTASDGFAALRMLRDTSYDVVLVDYHLPEMDGFALARLMRDISKEHSAPLRLIGLSADRHGLAARRGSSTLFDAILSKPYDPIELIRLVTTIKQMPAPQPASTAGQEAFTDPGVIGARAVAASFWKSRGLAGLPRAVVLPDPSLQQVAAIQLCFDIVADAEADVILVLDARGMQELVRSRLGHGAIGRPIVTLDPSLASVSDEVFAVADRASWSAVASRLARQRAC